MKTQRKVKIIFKIYNNRLYQPNFIFYKMLKNNIILFYDSKNNQCKICSNKRIENLHQTSKNQMYFKNIKDHFLLNRYFCTKWFNSSNIGNKYLKKLMNDFIRDLI
jgi:hypothetical protein